MLRLFLYFILLTLAAIWLARFAELPGAVTMDWNGWRIETSAVFLIVMAGITLIVSLTLIGFFRTLVNWPSRWRNQQRHRYHEQGMAELTEAFAAFAVADLTTARKLIRKADRHLGYAPLTTLLNAQLARMEGKDAEAANGFKKLLSYRETRFLAARSLLEQARRQGQADLALQYAEQAEKLRPDSPTTALALVDLYTLKHQWQKTLEAVEHARRHKAFTTAEANRFKALVFHQRAEELHAQQEDETALHFARQAHKLLPEMVPNTHLLARILHKLGMNGKIPAALQTTWKRFPHPSLSSLYRTLFRDEKPEKMLKRIEKLAAQAPDDIESQIAIAEAALEAGDFNKARNYLKIALSKQETPRICKLMARLAERESHDHAQAEDWMKRAVKADIGPSWTCESCQAIPPQWSLHCPECHAFDTVQWKINRLNFVDATPKPVATPRFEQPV